MERDLESQPTQQLCALLQIQNGIPQIDIGGHTGQRLMTSVDLKEAYLHIPLHPAHRRYLHFVYANRHFKYWTMLFRLSSALRTFTKLLVAGAAIRLNLICIMCYLDNILILSSSQAQATRHLATVIHTFHQPPISYIWSGDRLMSRSPDYQCSTKMLVTQITSLHSVQLLLLFHLLGHVDMLAHCNGFYYCSREQAAATLQPR